MKVHEGRVWNSEHRGRLWIHAASAEPDPEIVRSQLATYDMKAEDFDNWPTSCLLGFCTVTDVLPQDEYRKQYPDGPSNRQGFHWLLYHFPRLSNDQKKNLEKSVRFHLRRLSRAGIQAPSERSTQVMAFAARRPPIGADSTSSVDYFDFRLYNSTISVNSCVKRRWKR